MAKTSPTARTLARCRKQGWDADVVERWNPFAHKKKDVAGCIDVVAYGTECHVLGIQTTSGSNHAARRTKALEEPRLAAWLASGARFQIWSWTQPAGSRRWVLRVERFILVGGEVRVL